MIWLSLICLGQDSLSFLLRAKLTSHNIQVQFWKLLCVCADIENCEHKGTSSVTQSNIRHFLVCNQKIFFFFFVLASHGSSPVQLSVKSVPFPFWIGSSEWLLNLDSAYMGKVNCCPISFSNRRAGTWNICTVDKHCKEWNSHQTGTGYGQFKCLHTYEGKSHQIVQIICHFYSQPRTVWMQNIRLSGVCLLHD